MLANSKLMAGGSSAAAGAEAKVVTILSIDGGGVRGIDHPALGVHVDDGVGQEHVPREPAHHGQPVRRPAVPTVPGPAARRQHRGIGEPVCLDPTAPRVPEGGEREGRAGPALAGVARDEGVPGHGVPARHSVEQEAGVAHVAAAAVGGKEVVAEEEARMEAGAEHVGVGQPGQRQRPRPRRGPEEARVGRRVEGRGAAAAAARWWSLRLRAAPAGRRRRLGWGRGRLLPEKTVAGSPVREQHRPLERPNGRGLSEVYY